jgi:hypothetical protein
MVLWAYIITSSYISVPGVSTNSLSSLGGCVCRLGVLVGRPRHCLVRARALVPSPGGWRYDSLAPAQATKGNRFPTTGWVRHALPGWRGDPNLPFAAFAQAVAGRCTFTLRSEGRKARISRRGRRGGPRRHRLTVGFKGVEVGDPAATGSSTVMRKHRERLGGSPERLHRQIPPGRSWG